MRDDCGKRSTLPEEPKRGRMNRAVAAGGSKPRMHSSEAGCPENQLRQLRQWCVNAGHQLVHEYVDHESGRKGVNGRKQFAALFENAHKRKFDCVLFWALDRFTREGMVPTIMHLQRLASCGVGFHSYTEPHLATDNELVRDILLALLASLAKQEAKRMSERVKAGMARAKAQGKHLGRPAISLKLKQLIAE